MKPLLFLLLAAAPVLAQESTVSLRIMAFPRVDDDRPLRLLAGDQTIEVKPRSNRLSEAVEVPARDEWNFGHLATNEAGESAFVSLGKAPSAKSARQFVVLLRKGPKNEDGFRVLAFDDGPGHFKERQIFFLNLAGEPVAGDVGDVKFALKPGQHTVITPEANQGENLCHASLMLRDGDKWRPFMSSNWPIRDGTRGLIFVYGDPASSKVRLHTIRDVP